MLVQQAQVAGFDGSTLQLSFEHAGTRDGFVNGGHDEILRQAISDSFGMAWRIDCIIDPSVGRGPGPGSAGGQAVPQPQSMQQAAQPSPQQQYQAPPAQQFTPPPAQSAPPVPPPAAPAQPSPAPPPAAPVPDPHPLSPDDETIPEEEAGYGQGMVSGPELIMRELGATVIQEIDHDR
jgi:DNA polymerase-3 subunit gamma/tau